MNLLVLAALLSQTPSALDHARRGYDLARQGRAAEAAAALEQAIRLDASNPGYHAALGGIHLRAGQLEPAVASFTRAADLAPANAAIAANLESAMLEWGAGLARAERYKAGRTLAHRAAVRFPKSSRVHQMLGLFETKNQENVSAAASYRKALTLDPACSACSTGLGVALTAAGSLSEAHTALAAGLARFQDPAHHLALATVLIRQAELAPSLELAAAARRHIESARTGGLTDPKLTAALHRLPQPRPRPPALHASFADITTAAGIRWRHANAASAHRYIIETTTGGLAFFDYDNDGLIDLFLVTGSGPGARHALYRNLGGFRFEDVTARAGLAGPAPDFGMGAAAADFDNDGDQDLFLTGFPNCRLYRNHNGVFTDITAQAGVANTGEWAAGAAWFDADNDGQLDLIVANYARFSFDNRPACDFAGRPAYCAQTQFEGRPLRLYRNRGGVFTAETFTQFTGRALGIVAIDYDADGHQDLFVARDASPNLLLRNRGGGRFEDLGLEAQVAFNPDGVARAGMGIDAADADGDGHPDFAVTNFDTEYHALYLNPGRLPFTETTTASGLAVLTRDYVGWGIRFLDANNDGHQDLAIANGHLHEHIALASRTVTYREPALILLNDGAGRFTNSNAIPGTHLGRGLATADIDNDGLPDLAFISLGEAPRLLHNRTAPANWVGLKLRGTRANRDAIGARAVLRQGSRTLTRWVTGGGSFLASHDRRLLFGLADSNAPCDVEIHWPSGSTQRIASLAPGRYHEIIETP
ncbi:MAG: CRTAC1 family protein [Acidobacteria bacterium]|nr:CRTAC1 family protein [Acidobacteriota bacterium]